MKILSYFRFLSFCLLSFFSSYLAAEIHGKIDIGPTFVSVDILESGKTEDTIRFGAVKGDLTLLVWKGLAFKSGFMIGEGKKHAQFTSGYIGLGQYIPVTDKFMILPSIGVTFSYLKTHVDFEHFQLFDLKERFRSSSPYVGIDFSYKLTDKLTVVGICQYAWCHTHTKIKPIVSSKSHSNGPNYSLGLDYSFNANWTLTAGVGYNITLSREKHGLRGKGAKIGMAYYF
ncbi:MULTISPECIES: outer membrane beta-barrel protein [Candidatus Protochlamydia]|uniref:Protochlamydia outer membrane protein domain-containing protein n=1 Tax=Protochlamydia amoebophila (strain UWE25) TaxID=264201 RepID=Q6M9Q1_PARUW|nr:MULTISPECIES: outer membrane beta-barrel protein [Protochlamydia]CAF24698.1 unnamed protein product [Candidatus Protochlamydia amoebophila UWE25]